MAIAAYSPNERFTKRLLELGIIPKNCAEWQLSGKPGDTWTIKSTVHVTQDALDEVLKAIEEEKPELVEEIVLAAGNSRIGPLSIPRHLHP